MMDQSTVAILRHFSFDHLRADLQEIAQPFHALAHEMAGKCDGPQLAAGLQKLLEAKDCMVRAALEPIFRDRVHGNFTGGQ